LTTVDEHQSSAPYAHQPTEEPPCRDHQDDVETHYASLERLRPHACYEGLVYIGHLAEEDGEEVEVVEAVPCGRCAGEDV
jgi:hypothetical protein